MRHFITLNDIRIKELNRILDLSSTIKREWKQGERTPYLTGKMLGMIFEKQTLRTRVSFETGMFHLGGSSMTLGDEAGFGKRESVKDFAEVLSSMVNVVMIRAKKHQSVKEFARYSRCPVINGLTDACHPCQAIADVLTIREEFGSFQGLKIVWVGDANNVAVSLIQACSQLGMSITIAAPQGFQFAEKNLPKIIGKEQAKGFKITLTDDPAKAVKDAHAVFTDVWVSMGQEAEEEHRKTVFAPYQVNETMMKKARKNAIFLHCLPARRGLEVTDGVMDSEQSRVIQEAENRLHAQKGMLVWLLTEANQ